MRTEFWFKSFNGKERVLKRPRCSWKSSIKIRVEEKDETGVIWLKIGTGLGI